MTQEELEQAIKETQQQICRLKEQLNQATDPGKEKQLLTKIKELQIKQLWHLDQLNGW